jgi:hypothetical protein
MKMALCKSRIPTFSAVLQIFGQFSQKYISYHLIVLVDGCPEYLSLPAYYHPSRKQCILAESYVQLIVLQ